MCLCVSGNYFAGRHPSLLQITIIATTVKRIMLKAKISDQLQQRTRPQVVKSNRWNWTWRLLNSPSHYAHHQYWLSFRLLCQQRCAVCDLWFTRSEHELNWIEHELIRACWTEYFEFLNFLNILDILNNLNQLIRASRTEWLQLVNFSDWESLRVVLIGSVEVTTNEWPIFMGGQKNRKGSA